MRILIIYGSSEGQTQKIADTLAMHLRDKGHEASVYSGKRLPADIKPAAYEGVIIGASIHMNRFPAYIRHFITTHKRALQNKPAAFFTVCMAVHSQNEAERRAATAFGEKLFADTGWQPALAATFAGAVKYTRYNFITRFIMKQISRREGGSVDTSQDHEYTDWAAVSRFADQFLARLG